MAEGKKSFIVYTSWKMWLDGLTKEQKGIWLDWMMDYCNDLNPEYPKDQAVKISCMMAQDTLKRDLKKYEERKERMKIARNQNPNNNKELENNVNATNNRQKSVSNQSDISSVNVNDNVNVNVNDNDIISNDINNNKKNISSEPRELALELPTIYDYKKGNIYPVYQDQIDKWQEVYIGVDVNLELNKMLVWLEANPSKKKTYNGMARFIVNWLSRQQDSAARNGIVNQTNETERRQNETEAEYKKRMNGGFEIL